MSDEVSTTARIVTASDADAAALAATPASSPELKEAGEYLLEVGAKAGQHGEVHIAPEVQERKLMQLDASNKAHDWLFDILGEPFSAILYGKNKLGKTTETLQAFPDSLLVCHSKATLRAYANMARLNPTAYPKPLYLEIPQFARDPKTKKPIKEVVQVRGPRGESISIERYRPTNIEASLKAIVTQIYPVQADKNPNLRGMLMDEITVFMGWQNQQGQDPTICPQFEVTKPGQEPSIDGWAVNRWLMETLMFLWRAAPRMINGYMIQLGNERDPSLNKDTGVITLGGPELVTKTQAEKGSHEVDYLLRIAKLPDSAPNKHAIISQNNEQYRAGSRAGALVEAIEPDISVRDWFVKAGVILD